MEQNEISLLCHLMGQRRRKRRAKTRRIISQVDEDDLGYESIASATNEIIPVIKSIPRMLSILLLALFSISLPQMLTLQYAQALHVTNFRVPAYVPITLPTVVSHNQQQQQTGSNQRHQLADLIKPILFDCDYDYQPDEDAKLTVRWFRNKEPEPFYQWLPELNVRHFADWIKPLLNQSFVSDPHDPMKRYRSLLIKRLSMNLTGQYTCMVSSLAGQDMRQSSLVVYQGPRAFTFEHKVFPAPAALPFSSRPMWAPAAPQPVQSQQTFRALGSASPTHFKSHGPGGVVRPPNNNVSTSNPMQLEAGKIVYTHDGRPVVKRPPAAGSPKSKRQISEWMLKRKLSGEVQFPVPRETPETSQQPDNGQQFVLQLHHIQCQAVQVTPRPIIALLVKRDAESIVQYLHESSSFSIRAHQVNQADYYYDTAGAVGLATNRTVENNENNGFAGDQTVASSSHPTGDADSMMITLYDITVSATVALNVSLSPSTSAFQATSAPLSADQTQHQPTSRQQQQGSSQRGRQLDLTQQQPATMGITTVLPFRRGQRMSFECHLEITGTEFEQRKRININEQEVYQFVEMEQQKRRLRQQGQDYHDFRGSPSNLAMPDGGDRTLSGTGNGWPRNSQSVGSEDDSSSSSSLELSGLGPLHGLLLAVTTIICFITSEPSLAQRNIFGTVKELAAI